MERLGILYLHVFSDGSRPRHCGIPAKKFGAAHLSHKEGPKLAQNKFDKAMSFVCIFTKAALPAKSNSFVTNQFETRLDVSRHFC